MTSRDFCYWLQGFFEIVNAGFTRDAAGFPKEPVPNGGGLNLEQTAMIRRHLAMVFAHEIDPQAGPPAHQKVLSDIHNPPDIRPTTAPDIGPKNTLLRC